MTFLNPWLLLAVLPVVAVAILSLLRPGRAEVIVPTLQWWLAALEASGGAARRRTARLRLAWVLLLIGAVAGALALARPAGVRHASARWVRLELLPAIETGGYGGYPFTLQPAALAVLDRLGSADRVQLVLPELLGGAQPWAKRDEARQVVRQIAPLPALARELTLPPAQPGRAQLVVTLAPATVTIPAGPGRAVVSLPTRVPLLTVQQFGAEILDEQTVAAYLAVRNNTDRPLPVSAFVAMTSRQAGPAEPVDATFNHQPFVFPVLRAEPPNLLPPGQVAAATGHFPRQAVLSFSGSPGKHPQSFACAMVERPARPIRVVTRGEPSAVLVRYLAAEQAVVVVDEPGDADMEICCGAGPSGDLPCLLIDPPKAATGWRAGSQVKNISLGDASLAGDDPLLEGTAAGTMAVRRARPWAPGNRAGGVMVIGQSGRAVIWRSAADRQPRQVALNFALSAENTNIQDAPAWVVLLGNAVRWLSPATARPARYEWTTPAEAVGWRDWTRKNTWPHATQVPAAGPLAWPGMYVDRQGDWHAVNPPLGIRSAEPAVPPGESIASIQLPAPAPVETAWEAWPALALLAGLCWCVGWAVTLQWK
jgi:hypothetical protein